MGEDQDPDLTRLDNKYIREFEEAAARGDIDAAARIGDKLILLGHERDARERARLVFEDD